MKRKDELLIILKDRLSFIEKAVDKNQFSQNENEIVKSSIAVVELGNQISELLEEFNAIKSNTPN